MPGNGPAKQSSYLTEHGLSKIPGTIRTGSQAPNEHVPSKPVVVKQNEPFGEKPHPMSPIPPTPALQMALAGDGRRTSSNAITATAFAARRSGRSQSPRRIVRPLTVASTFENYPCGTAAPYSWISGHRKFHDLLRSVHEHRS